MAEPTRKRCWRFGRGKVTGRTVARCHDPFCQRPTLRRKKRTHKLSELCLELCHSLLDRLLVPTHNNRPLLLLLLVRDGLLPTLIDNIHAPPPDPPTGHINPHLVLAHSRTLEDTLDPRSKQSPKLARDIRQAGGSL